MSAARGELHELGVAALGAELAAGRVSSEALTKHLLARIAEHQQLVAFLCTDAEPALRDARAADARRAAGQARGPLDGVPIAHKDIYVTTDFPSTAASRMLVGAAGGYRSPFDAAVVAGLKEAGSVALGKLNCDEFAMGGSNEKIGRASCRERVL